MIIRDKFSKLNPVDGQYLTLLEKILEEGVEKTNRTTSSTKSIFGETMRVNLQSGFPLVTTKKMWFKGIWAELYWMLGLHRNDPKYAKFGITNLKFLIDNDIHIWTNWGVEQYMKKMQQPVNQGDANWKFCYELYVEKIKTDDNFAQLYGDLGEIYGYQWNKWSKMVSKKTEIPFKPYLKKKKVGNKYNVTINQIEKVIYDLRKNPDSRRIKLTAWQPISFELGLAALPCCHYDVTFQSIEKDGKRYLNSSFKLRSSDFFVAGNWNTAFYAILTHIIAKLTNHIPNDLVYYADDIHIYDNLIEAANEQLSRTEICYDLPQLHLEEFKELSDISFDSVSLKNYKSYPQIKCEVVL